jgi:hypothetical protein
MAFNQLYPYQQMGYYPQGYPVVNQPVPQQPVQNQTQQIQNGGFVTVRSESEARSYPVAPGMSVTFKHETAPYCYTKTMGFSQFEAPRFEKFRLVKEDEEAEVKDEPKVEYASKGELLTVVEAVKGIDGIISSLKSDVDGLKTDVYGLSGKRKKKTVEVEEDE